MIGKELGCGIVISSYIRQAWRETLEEWRSKEMVQLGFVERQRRRGTEDLLVVERVVPNGSE